MVEFATQVENPAESGQQETSLHSEVLERLRDYIVEGNIPEGGRIPERQLCETFGISRTPLREALKVLASDGLVELMPNRGARVRSLSAHDIKELFDLMGGFEALAGRLACERITEEQFEEVLSLHTEMYGHYLRDDRHHYFRTNQLIHDKILEISGNSALIRSARSLSASLRRVRYAANLDDKGLRWAEAVREHEQIIDALRRRDADALASILFHHLRNKSAAVLRSYEEAYR
ncbi:GntR family transcriptional regulator [Pelagibacterium lacus]|uniref:GntR family transcriptional regulator n=1 Tax=Pelagibacterium lacus TaxID=2282655 RepID=A0A369W003_9HYPH|nr:GntR family transcriptional regulator [Pelagibacterium lacus]RDE07888.1 GntR family transcriptional regulator [Pelagibacterium lacus]